MLELSLFSGAGGGLLGSHLLGWETIGYVEIDDYCQRVIAQRIKDGILREAPIFGDIRAFLSEGYAESYQGMVDVVTAGFPCQPYSIAGSRRADQDERNRWPETIDCIRRVGPGFAVLENVPLLVSYDYFGEILGDLAEAGFDASWEIVSAEECGAVHLRERVWILAENTNSNCTGRQKQHVSPFAKKQAARRSGNDYQLSHESCTYPASERRKEKSVPRIRSESQRLQSCNHGDIRHALSIREAWGICEPRVVGMADDVAHRVDRIRAAGNGQVPGVVVRAWEILNIIPHAVATNRNSRTCDQQESKRL